MRLIPSKFVLSTVAAASVVASVYSPLFAQNCIWEMQPGPTAPISLTGIKAFTMWDADGAGPANPKLVVGGGFSIQVGMAGLPVLDLATETWSTAGILQGGAVYSLAVSPDNTLYAGGAFSYNNGTALVSRVARWDPGSGQWQPLGAGFASDIVYDLEWNPSMGLFATGSFATAGMLRLAHWNGTAWEGVGGTGLGGGVSEIVGRALATDATGALLVGGRFTAVSGVPANAIARWNGTTWSALGTGITGAVGSAPRVNAIHVLDDGRIVAGGLYTLAGGASANNIAVWNGSVWSALGTGTAGSPNGEVNSVTSTTTGDIIIGGGFNQAGGTGLSGIARWNGSTWSPIDNGVSSAPLNVPASIRIPDGRIVIGGDLVKAGSTSARGVAVLENNEWNTFGTGTNGVVAALATQRNTDVVVGGYFKSLRNVEANRIARWDVFGNTIKPLGSGVNREVLAVAPDQNGNIYAGGRFTAAGLVPASRVARWNRLTETWSALGTGTTGDVNALLLRSNGTLAVSGFFSSAGGLNSANIATWNPSTNTWSAMENGTNAAVLALVEMPDGSLVAGGQFTVAGSTFANRVARWTGTTWQALGTGMNNQVLTLAVSQAGELLAGGSFTNITETNCRVAKWDGTTWSRLGNVTSSVTTSLTVMPDGMIFAAGDFQAGGNYKLMRYNPFTNSWSPVTPANVDSPLVTCSRPNGELFVGGTFGSVTNTTAYVARFGFPLGCLDICDSIDFNNDGSVFDPIDIDALLSVFGEGPCIPTDGWCNDIDINNDSSQFDPCDIDAFLVMFGEGPCTLCGQ